MNTASVNSKITDNRQLQESLIISNRQKYFFLGGLSSIVIFFLGTTLAAFSYSGYDFFAQYFSELGHRGEFTIERDDGSIDNYSRAPYPEIFNLTLIIAGFLFIPFFFNIYPIFKQENLSRYFFMISAIPGTLAGGFLIGVGIFDSATDLDTHVWFALNLYLSILISTLFWVSGILLLSRDSFYKQYNNIPDYIMSIFIVVLMVINYVNTAPPIPILVDIPIPTYQKAVAYCFMGYFGLVCRRMFNLVLNTN